MKVVMFVTRLKDLHDPVLHIVFVMGDMLEKEFFHNNHALLIFLSITVQLQSKASFLHEVNGRLPSEWILQTLFLDEIIEPLHHGMEVLV
jgi:hypothetical protein